MRKPWENCVLMKTKATIIARNALKSQALIRYRSRGQP